MHDIHCHILPGVDDGARDWDISLAMLKIAVEQGTLGLVATPHVIDVQNTDFWQRITEGCDLLTKEAARAGHEVAIRPGAEVAISADLLSVLQAPGPYCINGQKHILLELPSLHIPHYIDDFFFTLQLRGFGIVLAHPERHPELMKQPSILWEWLNKGILVQMNGMSLVGGMGSRVMRFAELLVNSGAVYCLGSDAHGSGRRNPGLKQASEKLAMMVGRERAMRLLVENPLKLLAGEAEPDYETYDFAVLEKRQSSPLRLLKSLLCMAD